MPLNVDKLRLCYLYLMATTHLSTEEQRDWNNGTLGTQISDEENDGDDHDFEDAFDDYFRKYELGNMAIQVNVALCVVSALVSMMNVLVFSSKSMITSTLNILLLSVEVANIMLALFQLTSSCCSLIFGVFITNVTGLILKLVASASNSVCAAFLCWISVVICVWQLVAVRRPLRATVLLTKRKAMFCIVSAVLLNAVLEIIRNCLYEMRIYQLPVCSNLEGKNTSSVDWYTYFLKPTLIPYYKIVNGFHSSLIVIYYVLPFGLYFAVTGILVLCICSKRSISPEARTGGNESQTRITVTLVVLFCCFVISNFVDAMYVLLTPDQNEQNFTLLLIISNRSPAMVINILSLAAYYFMSAKFRRAFAELWSRTGNLFRCHLKNGGQNAA